MTGKGRRPVKSQIIEFPLQRYFRPWNSSISCKLCGVLTAVPPDRIPWSNSIIVGKKYFFIWLPKCGSFCWNKSGIEWSSNSFFLSVNFKKSWYTCLLQKVLNQMKIRNYLHNKRQHQNHWNATDFGSLFIMTRNSFYFTASWPAQQKFTWKFEIFFEDFRRIQTDILWPIIR